MPSPLSKLDIASGSANVDGMSSGKVFSRVSCIAVIPANLCPPFSHAGVEVGVFFGCLGYGLVPLLEGFYSVLINGRTFFAEGLAKGVVTMAEFFEFSAHIAQCFIALFSSFYVGIPLWQEFRR